MKISKPIAILLSLVMVMGAFTVIPASVTALSVSDEDVQSISEMLEDNGLEREDIQRIYFQMPNGNRGIASEQDIFFDRIISDPDTGETIEEHELIVPEGGKAPTWYNDHNLVDGKHYPAVYWWGGTGACGSYCGYRAEIEDYDQGIYYADIPLDVPKIEWNNGVDGGVDPTDPIYSQPAKTCDLWIEGCDECDYDSLPYGTPQFNKSFDRCIFIVDPGQMSKNAYSGQTTYGVTPYVYYGNGCYGSEYKDGTEFDETDNWSDDMADICKNPDHFDSAGNHVGYHEPEPPTEAPTDPPTEAPTDPYTEAPTDPPTEAPTAPPTEAPTAPPTEAPTDPSTEAPTELPAADCTLVVPDQVEVEANAEWTAMPFDVSSLVLGKFGNDKTAARLRLVLEGGTLTGQDGKTIPFGMSNTINTQTVRNQRMLDWYAANTPQNMNLYISPGNWSAAAPGTYTGTISYHLMWLSTDNRWSPNFGYGSFPVTTTIPEPSYSVTVTHDPGYGGTASASVESAQEGTTVTLTATPNKYCTFKEWQVVSGNVTIENDQFTMPGGAVEIKAVFEPAEVPYIDAAGVAQTPLAPTEYTVIDENALLLQGGWYVVTHDVEIGNRIMVDGDVNLLLINGATLTAHKGIDVTKKSFILDEEGEELQLPCSLTIWQQAAEPDIDTGKLIVDNVDYGDPGIGGEGCVITVNGGDLDIAGNTNGAGIGCQSSKSFGVITINAGTIRAVGGEYAADIGNGLYGMGGTININGGVISAVNGGIGYSSFTYNPDGTFINLDWSDASRASMSVTANAIRGEVNLKKAFSCNIDYGDYGIETFKYPAGSYSGLSGGTYVPDVGVIRGDADADGFVAILDATAIQHKLADFYVESYDETAADADGDGFVTIFDATVIQRHLAGFNDGYDIGAVI